MAAAAAAGAWHAFSNLRVSLNLLEFFVIVCFSRIAPPDPLFFFCLSTLSFFPRAQMRSSKWRSRR